MNRALQPLHTREFNIDAAKAGAPYALACGWPVEIFKWDGKNPGGPIMGAFGVDDRISTWRANGEFSIQDNPRLALVMTPLFYVDGKPVFVGDKLQCVRDGKPFARFFVMEPGHADKNPNDWCWPAPPKVYPMTKMAVKQLVEAYQDGAGGWDGSYVCLANAVLRHYIDNLTTLPDDCALRAKLVEMGWTAPDTSDNWQHFGTLTNAKEGAR